MNGDDMDEYLKEIGVGFMGRALVKTIKPRLVITENDGIWTIRTETPLRTLSLDLKPGIEYEETTPDGRQLRVICTPGINERTIDFTCFFLSGNTFI